MGDNNDSVYLQRFVLGFAVHRDFVETIRWDQFSIVAGGLALPVAFKFIFKVSAQAVIDVYDEWRRRRRPEPEPEPGFAVLEDA